MSDLNDRVTELEIRYTHQQELLSALNDLVRDQQSAIDELRLQLSQLESQSGLENPPNEKPPHY